MFTEKDFIRNKYKKTEKTFDLTAQAPSNIALVKYWGKYPKQIPMNPSVSFTLNKSKTTTKAIISPNHSNKDINFKFYFKGKHKPDFEPKIKQFFQNILKYAPFLKDYFFEIDSKNSFPHSSGIASSASAFAALTKILILLEKQITIENKNEDFWTKKTSFLARIGSGSASRSIEYPVSIWGKHPNLKYTSDLYAVKPDFEIHPIFNNYNDSIILVEEGQKQVSSTAGHKLMENHPYKNIRKQQAFDNTIKILEILKNGNVVDFIDIVEQEALTLHALMMTSTPNYILMQAETLQIIHSIRKYREQTGVNLCFTLDAGANVHVLYPEINKIEVLKFLETLTTKKIIHDNIS